MVSVFLCPLDLSSISYVHSEAQIFAAKVNEFAWKWSQMILGRGEQKEKGREEDLLPLTGLSFNCD